MDQTQLSRFQILTTYAGGYTVFDWPYSADLTSSMVGVIGLIPVVLNTASPTVIFDLLPLVYPDIVILELPLSPNVKYDPPSSCPLPKTDSPNEWECPLSVTLCVWFIICCTSSGLNAPTCSPIYGSPAFTVDPAVYLPPAPWMVRSYAIRLQVLPGSSTLIGHIDIVPK